jgi:hypothetical protein
MSRDLHSTAKFTAKFNRDTNSTCPTTKGPEKEQCQLGPRAVPGLTRRRLFCFARRALRGTPHHTTPRAQVTRPQTRRDALSACPWRACGCANIPNINLRRGHMKLGHLAPPAPCGPDCSCLTVACHRAFAGTRLLVVVEADSQDSGFGAHALRSSAQEQVSVVSWSVSRPPSPPATWTPDSRRPYLCGRSANAQGT